MCLQGEIKQEYEGKDARALMYEALEEVTASDQESMAVIEQRVRMLLGSYQQKCPVLITPKPEVRPIPVFNGIPLEFGKVPVELVIQQRKPKVAVNQLSLFG